MPRGHQLRCGDNSWGRRRSSGGTTSTRNWASIAAGKGDERRLRPLELAEPRPDYDLSRISAASRMAVHSAMTMFKTALIRERS